MTMGGSSSGDTSIGDKSDVSGPTPPVNDIQRQTCITQRWNALRYTELSHNLVSSVPLDHFEVNQ